MAYPMEEDVRACINCKFYSLDPKLANPIWARCTHDNARWLDRVTGAYKFYFCTRERVETGQGRCGPYGDNFELKEEPTITPNKLSKVLNFIREIF